MSGFNSHGMEHTSASQINMWAESPDFWISRYLFNNKGLFGGLAKAGVLAEDAVVNVIAKDMDIDDAIELAVKEYEKFIILTATDSEIKRGKMIPGFVKLAVENLEEYGKPEFDNDLFDAFKQKRIEILCKGDTWELPIIGYIDFHFPQHKLVVDLKTTGRMPSVMSTSHKRQQAIYKQAFIDHEVKFLYVTDKKAKLFDCEDHMEVLKEIKVILSRQEKFLSLGPKDLLKDIVPVKSDSFYWSDNEATRMELFGM